MMVLFSILDIMDDAFHLKDGKIWTNFEVPKAPQEPKCAEANKPVKVAVTFSSSFTIVVAISELPILLAFTILLNSVQLVLSGVLEHRGKNHTCGRSSYQCNDLGLTMSKTTSMPLRSI
ncbi:hypothetical protein SUGI_1075850 [Cryptomeria japonica]|nr:hypothetical protein SUGI_1075850 [Cryptomeria japonica]